jgi:hypothetical protein
MDWLRRLWTYLSTPQVPYVPTAGSLAVLPSTGTTSAAERPLPPWEERYGYLGAVGESQYQPALQRAARSGRICWATLLPEPDNPFDANAVAVQVGGETVGYLSRTDARRYQRRLRVLIAPIQVPAKLIGGTRGKPHFGVLLDCREVEQLPQSKAVRKKRVNVDPADQPF